MAPASESTSIYNSYKNNGKLNNVYTFKIPVYNSMTANAYKVSRTDMVGGKEENNGGNTENTPSNGTDTSKPTVSPETKVSNAGYSLSTGYLTKINVGEDMSTLRQKLSNQGAIVASLNSSWNSKTSGALATGDIIEIDKTKRYEVVVYGDIDGDANISVVDLLYLKKYILGDMSLNAPNKTASDISKDGKTDVVDLLLLKKHILRDYTITQ